MRLSNELLQLLEIVGKLKNMLDVGCASDSKCVVGQYEKQEIAAKQSDSC